MVMSWIWTGIVLISILCALVLGNGSALAAATVSGAQAGIQLALSMAGSLCLWTGAGRLMEHAGITRMLSRLLRPSTGTGSPPWTGQAVSRPVRR